MMTETRCHTDADGTVTLWVDGHPWLLTESAQQRRAVYGRWAAVWRNRAARFWLSGESEQARTWAALADTAEAMCRRVEERG